MLTPLLAKLRARHPEAELVMTLPKAFAPLYSGRPYGVVALGWDPREPWASGVLEHGGFDLALVPGDNRHTWLAQALGARWIVAFDGDRPPYKSWLADQLIAYPDVPGAWGDMVAGLIAGSPPDPFQTGDWPPPAVTRFDKPAGQYALLHLGASTPLKRWLPERWRALAAGLAAAGVMPVWSAGRGEEFLIRDADPDARWPSYAGTLDLAQLWHLVAGAVVLVCPDTGVAHLGRIAGTPTVTLFGPGSPVLCGAGSFWRDSPYRAVWIDPFPCRDQRLLFKREIPWVRRCARKVEECGAPRCLQSIELAAVSDAIRDLGIYLEDRDHV